MKDKYIEAERRLAELMGWKPKYAEPSVNWIDGNDKTVYADWCRNRCSAFALMAEHGPMVVSIGPGSVAASGIKGVIEVYSDHPDKETAVRYAITQAVIAKLEAGRESAKEES